jgi:hypothetical protein
MTRDEARAHWAKSGLTYAALTAENLRRLRSLIDQRMRTSGAMGGTLRACQRFSIHNDHPNGKWAALKCKAFYFGDRQAVTFEPGGFIGFAGWADETNVQPILTAFCSWVDLMATNSVRPIEEARRADEALLSNGQQPDTKIIAQRPEDAA